MPSSTTRTSNFTFHALDDLPGPVVVEHRVFEDERGWFTELFQADAFEAAGLPGHFAQDNHSSSRRRGTLRGLHYQAPPHGQGKLIRCCRGRVFDVVADIRKGSPTFARWRSVELDASVPRLLWVPEGFAHGFCSLTDDAEVGYKVTRAYHAESDAAIAWNDPDLAVRWPVEEPILSDKDAAAPRLRDVETGFAWEGA